MSVLEEVIPMTHPTVSEVMFAVTKHYGLNRIDMVSDRRARRVAHPRQVAMYLATRLTPLSLPAIGRIFGDRDHTTVIHATRAVQKRMAADPVEQATVTALESKLTGEIENG